MPNQEIISKICELAEQGFKDRQISERLNLPLNTVKRIRIKHTKIRVRTTPVKRIDWGAGDVFIAAQVSRKEIARRLGCTKQAVDARVRVLRLRSCGIYQDNSEHYLGPIFDYKAWLDNFLRQHWEKSFSHIDWEYWRHIWLKTGEGQAFMESIS